jgi:hypothetical protein
MNLREVFRIKVLTAVVKKGSSLWNITPCSPFESQPTFLRKMAPPSSTQVCLLVSYLIYSSILKMEANAGVCLLPASRWSLALLILDPEDGGDIFFPNVGMLSTDYLALHPRSILCG